VNETFFVELSEWLTKAGLAGMSETDIVAGFCERCVAAGLPLARALLFIDTLHPVHEGRLFRWATVPPSRISVSRHISLSPSNRFRSRE
jgi:adenylate cyclase